MKYIWLCCCMVLVGCATQSRTYQPPDSTRLKASTHRVSVAVDAAHVSARKAQGSVVEAAKRVKHAREEVAKLKNVPRAVVQEIESVQSQLEDTRNHQLELEQHLQEADQAKAQVEKDKIEYFNSAQTLANQATAERNHRIKAEKALSWYRWHWWGSWIVLGAGVIACGIFAFLKFTGKLLI